MKTGLLTVILAFGTCIGFAQEPVQPFSGPFRPDAAILAKQVLELQKQIAALNGRVKKLERENGYRILPLQNVTAEPSRE